MNTVGEGPFLETISISSINVFKASENNNLVRFGNVWELVVNMLVLNLSIVCSLNVHNLSNQDFVQDLS